MMKQEYQAPELFAKSLQKSKVLNGSNDVNIDVGNGKFDAE